MIEIGEMSNTVPKSAWINVYNPKGLPNWKKEKIKKFKLQSNPCFYETRDRANDMAYSNLNRVALVRVALK